MNMDVLESNFDRLYQSIVADIENCTFLSWDGEFTGIRNENYKAMAFDTVAERYGKLRKGNMSYLMCQVGLCTFTLNDEGGFTAKPYNFYICPKEFNHTSPEFICQASCLQFLSSHGFDFNKTFREGISFLRSSQISKIRDKMLGERQEKQNNDQTIPLHTLRTEDQKFVGEVCEAIEVYLLNEDQKDDLKLEPCNAFRRRLVYEQAKSRYSDRIHLQTTGAGSAKYITIKKVTSEEKLLKDQEVIQKDEQKLQDAVGFSRIIQVVSSSKKPIVGHNMLLDLMYVISQFVAELPESYDDFKSMTMELFPKLFDTKVMSSTSLFKDDIPSNSLEELIKALDSPMYEQVKIDIPEDFPQFHTSDETKFHNAGYDAFITGKSFAIMSKHVMKKANQPIKSHSFSEHHLSPFFNKLYVHNMQDVPYMNLSGQEVLPDRSHTYHLTFPADWTRNDINQVFSPYPVYVHWIDRQAAMVTLQERTDAPKVTKMLKSHVHSCEIKTYNQWLKEKLKAETCAEPPSIKTKRKIPESSEAVLAKVNKTEKSDSVIRDGNELNVSSGAKLFEEDNTW